MGPIRLTFIGCGDAFSSGGRLHTCLYLEGGEEPMLVDCGATSLAGLKRERIDPASIGSVAVSHLHGDHFAGIAWMVIEGRLAKRVKPLLIGGPPTASERLRRASEALYPGSGDADNPFEVRHVEFSEGTRCELGPSAVTPFEVIHSSGAPSYALRVEYGGKVVAYSGDAEWTDNLISAARGADLSHMRVQLLRPARSRPPELPANPRKAASIRLRAAGSHAHGRRRPGTVQRVRNRDGGGRTDDRGLTARRRV